MLALITSLDASLDAWSASLGWPMEGFLRLALAAVAGAIVGIEREVSVKYAGFRTMILVCVGSCLVMMVSTQLALERWPEPTPGNNISVDPGRIAYGIMTGIGFLGAGTIMSRGNQPKGLTTAAAIWCVAATGMAIGFGLYSLALVATVIVLIALWMLDYVERLLPRRRIREVVLRARYRPELMRETLRKVERFLKVHNIAMRRRDDLDYADITLEIAYNNVDAYREFESHLEDDQDYQLISSKDLG